MSLSFSYIQVSLIFGNISEEDIILRKELDALAAAHEGRFKVRGA